MSLEGKTAVIAGASRGIGAAVAHQLQLRPMTESSWG
jgi:NAD(P)-dependent dehydrogenase (short-subunit alcohol dehydrogenase family)